jgi:hypothetical protein
MFRLRVVLLYSFFATATIFQACKNPRPQQPAPPAFAAADYPEITDTLRSLQISWDKHETQISHEIYFAEYGRIIRFSKDTLILVYHCGAKGHEWDNIALRKSFDNGRSWAAPKIIVPDNKQKRYFGFSTPALLLLKDKRLLLAYTGRGIPDDSLHNNLQIRYSEDGGDHWGPPQIVAQGRSWEPGVVQLPDGEIQLFFSNEILSTKKAKGRHEQKVLMISSKSLGRKWSRPKTVAFTGGRRDGMPVPLVLKDNKGIVFAVEAVENERSPEIIWSSMKANWDYKEPGNIQNGRRWHGSVDPVWGGGPGLVQLSTGETLIVMQTEAGRKIDRYKGWKKNSVVVMAGNSLAKNFRDISFPYPDMPINEGRYFCSLFLKNDSTVVLVSTKNFPNTRSAIFWKEGHISRKKR